MPGPWGTAVWRDGELLTSSNQYVSGAMVIHSFRTQSRKPPLCWVTLWHGEGLA